MTEVAGAVNLRTSSLPHTNSQDIERQKENGSHGNAREQRLQSATVERNLMDTEVTRAHDASLMGDLNFSPVSTVHSLTHVEVIMITASMQNAVYLYLMKTFVGLISDVCF